MHTTPKTKVYAVRTLIEVFHRKTGKRFSTQIREPGDLVTVYDRNYRCVKTELPNANRGRGVCITYPSEGADESLCLCALETAFTNGAGSYEVTLDPAPTTEEVLLTVIPDAPGGAVTVSQDDVSVTPVSQTTPHIFAVSIQSADQPIVITFGDGAQYTLSLVDALT